MQLIEENEIAMNNIKGDKKTLTILHCMKGFLTGTENWKYNLIKNVPEARAVIAARKYYKNNFYNEKFEYIEFPLVRIQNVHKGSPVLYKLYNKLVSFFESFYPSFVTQQSGQLGVDLLHSHFAFVGWESRKIAHKLRIPHVVSYYGYDYEALLFRKPIWKERYRRLFHDADAFLCEGSHGASILKRLGCPANKVFINRLGVNVMNIPFTARLKEPGKLNLLQIARMMPKKGHIYTVKAFIEASKSCPNMTLTIVGSDVNELKKQLAAMVAENGLTDKVSFLDALDYSNLYKFLNDFQVFIHPSTYADDHDCEGGAPVVLLDAQATGMPVISTRHCDIPDEVIDKETGLLADERDVKALAAHIQRFYEMKQDEYDNFTRSARRHVEEFYDAEKNGARLRQIYEQVLKAYAQEKK